MKVVGGLGGGGEGGREVELEDKREQRDGERQRGSSESRGLASCQLDSLTPFGGEQTNRGISRADSVDPSQR